MNTIEEMYDPFDAKVVYVDLLPVCLSCKSREQVYIR